MYLILKSLEGDINDQIVNFYIQDGIFFGVGDGNE